MDKKEQIIGSARDLFTKYGYKKVSMDEIAQASSVTKRTVYSYFKDKDELFDYFVMEELNKMKKIINDIEAENKNTFDTFHKIIYALIKYKKESIFLNVMENEKETLKTKSVILSSKKIDESIISFIKERLLLRIEQGEIKKVDVDLCAYMIYTLYVSIIFNYSSENLNEQDVSDTLSTILKDGLFN